jgi:hypothetical protein
MRCSVRLLLALPVLLSPAASTAATASAAYKVLVHALPRIGEAPRNLAINELGFILSPVAGGLYATGWGGWLVPPSARSPLATVATSGSRLFVLRTVQGGLRLSEIGVVDGKMHSSDLGNLPNGGFEATATPGGAVLIWGRTKSGEWLLSRWTAKRGLQTLIRSRSPIAAVAAAGERGIIVAIGSVLVLLDGSGKASRLARLREPIAGMTAATDGALYVSTPKGTYRLRTGQPPELLLRGIYGPMTSWRKSVFVLSRSTRGVVELSSL